MSGVEQRAGWKRKLAKLIKNTIENLI